MKGKEPLLSGAGSACSVLIMCKLVVNGCMLARNVASKRAVPHQKVANL